MLCEVSSRQADEEAYEYAETSEACRGKVMFVMRYSHRLTLLTAQSITSIEKLTFPCPEIIDSDDTATFQGESVEMN